MGGIFIATYVLFGIMCVLGLIHLITLAIYTKYTLFTKTKYSWSVIAIYGLMFAILLIAGILFCTTLPKTLSESENCTLHASLCFGYLGLDVLGLIAYFIIIKINNKHKIPYDKIPGTNFKPDLDKIKAKLGDVEVVKNKLQKHHKKYYSKMLLAYQDLLKQAKDEKISLANKYANIVMFNDTFAHKWCTLMNNYHLLLVYEFLKII